MWLLEQLYIELGALTRETDTKKLSSFAKLQFLSDKIDQNTNFTKLPSAK